MAHTDAVLAVLEILKKYDCPEGLSHTFIAEKLDEDYGIVFKREKFADVIRQIDSMDEYSVICTKGKYSRYWLKQKYALDSVETAFICALIADTDVLSRIESDALIEKICCSLSPSFRSEEQIEQIKKVARSGKNEINGLDKLKDIDRAIIEKLKIRYKTILHSKEVSDYIISQPIEWHAESGNIIVILDDDTKVKVSEMLNLELI